MSKHTRYVKFLKKLRERATVDHTEDYCSVINITNIMTSSRRKIKKFLRHYPVSTTEVEKSYQDLYIKKYLVIQYKINQQKKDITLDELYIQYRHKLKQFTVSAICPTFITLQKIKKSDYAKSIRYFKNEPFLIINSTKTIILYKYPKEEQLSIFETLGLVHNNIADVRKYKYKLKLLVFKNTLPKDLYGILYEITN